MNNTFLFPVNHLSFFENISDAFQSEASAYNKTVSPGSTIIFFHIVPTPTPTCRGALTANIRSVNRPGRIDWSNDFSSIFSQQSIIATSKRVPPQHRVCHFIKVTKIPALIADGIGWSREVLKRERIYQLLPTQQNFYHHTARNTSPFCAIRLCHKNIPVLPLLALDISSAIV